MTAAPPAVHASSLWKSFGRRTAVSDIDFTLAAGDCLALFGPNGAGKTTLLRLVAGVLKPTAGMVRVNGADVRENAAARARIGLISHQSMLYAPLTALENLEFSARLYGVDEPRRAGMQALECMRVADRAHAPLRTLSRGLQQRVSIARATVHDPTVVLLDEPYTGLDDIGAQALTGYLGQLKSRGATLVLVTHNVAEGLALASHAAIISEGRFVRFEQTTGAALDARDYAATYRDLVSRAP